MTDKSFIALIDALKTKPAQTLKSLKLDCYRYKTTLLLFVLINSWTKLTDHALQYFSKEIHHFAILEHLDLSFGE